MWVVLMDGTKLGLEKAGVELILSEGSFVAHRTLGVADRTITAERIVIATGSRPADSPCPDLLKMFQF